MSTLTRVNGGGSGGKCGEHSEKRKFSRSKTACLPCRSRRSKCGALPPGPCINCVESNVLCEWPAEDGRSSAARRRRAPFRKKAKYRFAFVHPKQRNEPGQKHAAVCESGGGFEYPNSAAHFLDSFDPLSRSIGGSMGPPFNLNPSSRNPELGHENPGFVWPHNNGQFLHTQWPVHTNPPLATHPRTTASLASNVHPIPSPGLDSHFLVEPFSSRLPTVPKASPSSNGFSMSAPHDRTSARESQAQQLAVSKAKKEKTVKITWWRPHGQTAIAPGLKQITLKVRVHKIDQQAHLTPPQCLLERPQGILDADGMPAAPIMRHLLDVFIDMLGSLFPWVEKDVLCSQIENRSGSVFLFNAIAAVAARFSTHPAIVLPDSQPHTYGNIFTTQAKAMIGSMISVPSRDTIAALLFLALVGAGDDSESEVWMLIGMAVRMSQDLGLHLDPLPSSGISQEDRRRNRLLFWSVLMLDYSLSFGVGRSTTISPKDVVQVLPTEGDIRFLGSSSSTCPSPFPFAAKMTLLYGPLVNILNDETLDSAQAQADLAAARDAAVKEYSELPSHMKWNVDNLQRHNRANQAGIFTWLHLWMHTIIASEYLNNIPSQINVENRSTDKRGTANPEEMPSTSWRESVRTIGDILVLTDIINPHAYLAIPLINQCLYVAGCCYVKEIEQFRNGFSNQASFQVSSLDSLISEPAEATSETNLEIILRDAAGVGRKGGNIPPLFSASIARTNITCLQLGLEKQTIFWSGIAWIAESLKRRIEGIPLQEIDLKKITEQITTFVSLPDPGLAGHSDQSLADTSNFDDSKPMPSAGHELGPSSFNRSAKESFHKESSHHRYPTYPYQHDASFHQNSISWVPSSPAGDLNYSQQLFDAMSSDGGSRNVSEQHIPIAPSPDLEWYH